MISQTSKAKVVRKYFLEMEKIVKKYYLLIEEKLFKEIGLLKENQKNIKHKKGGVIYIFEALNKLEDDDLYKLGKSGDLTKRTKTYNTGNANKIKILFKIYVNDKDSVESCVKKALDKYKYNGNHEIFNIKLDMLKTIVKKCDDVAEEMKTLLEKYEKKTTKSIQRIKNDDNHIYLSIKEK